ncbi:MAG: general stress protein [Bryobacteraceae bacterium]|nr:general stress protein [Bryobacteraceae bacterium]
MANDTTVVGLFDSHDDAQDCLEALRDAGIRGDDISIVASNRKGKMTSRTGDEKTTDGTSVGENIAGGALFGGLGGLLIGLGALAIPGLGPIIAAGPIATTLAGAGIGAVGGGIIGAIKDAGVPDEEAHVYAEGVRRGGTLVTVRCDSVEADNVRNIMDDHGAVDIEERGAQYRSSGWSKFDPNASEYDYETTGTRTGSSTLGASSTGTTSTTGTRTGLGSSLGSTSGMSAEQRRRSRIYGLTNR